MNINYSIAKCKTKAAFSAKLKQKAKLDLTKIKNKFELILETPILVVIKVRGIEIIVHSHGELLFKTGNDLSILEEIAQEIYKIGLKNND